MVDTGPVVPLLNGMMAVASKVSGSTPDSSRSEQQVDHFVVTKYKGWTGYPAFVLVTGRI